MLNLHPRMTPALQIISRRTSEVLKSEPLAAMSFVGLGTSLLFPLTALFSHRLLSSPWAPAWIPDRAAQNLTAITLLWFVLARPLRLPIISSIAVVSFAGCIANGLAQTQESRVLVEALRLVLMGGTVGLVFWVKSPTSQRWWLLFGFLIYLPAVSFLGAFVASLASSFLHSAGAELQTFKMFYGATVAGLLAREIVRHQRQMLLEAGGWMP